MTKLRQIRPIAISDLRPLDLGARPVMEWHPPTELWVDDTYQRNMTRQSQALVVKVARGFRWNRMKPVVVVRTVEGQLHVIDGQHTAIAAASAGIDSIPVFIVGASEMSERARAFVDHNRDRTRVTSFTIYKALLAAGDPETVCCESVLRRAGARLRHLNQTVEANPGDTSAIGQVTSLVKVHGPMRARVVLETLVQADRVPITADEIKAATQLLWIDDKRVAPEQLIPVIQALGDDGLRTAQANARTQRTQVWRVLVQHWGMRARYAKAAVA